ncbi:MAG: ABC transporter permease [Acidobacteria bacterium]|nr:ABC transporter permease [Acidobacteriota bacterium]
MKKPERNRTRNLVPPLMVMVGVVGFWETLVWSFHMPTYILPAPSQIFLGLINDLGLLWVHAQVTTIEILVGFVMSLAIGVPCAILIVYSKPLESALYPLLVFSQIVPKIAVAPLFLIWFGFGWAPKILLVVLISIFPIIINTITGLKSVDPQAILMIRSMNASPVKIFCKVTFPSALPSLFGGLKIAITLAVIGAVVAEWVASERGLGYLLLSAGANFQSVLLFEALTVVTLIGALLFFLIDVLERRFVPQRSGESWLHG